ncbi:DNA-binding protein, partial [Streptomyces sp. NPDC001279]
RSMLEGLNRGTDLLDQMLGRVMVAAVNTGVRVDEVARWARLSEGEAVEVLGTYRGADGE